MICVPTFLLTTNLFRLPVASWNDNTGNGTNLPPSGNALNTSAYPNSNNRTLPLLNNSCGCWDAVAESRWVQLSLRAPTAVFGVEATLGHHFRVNVSSDGINWLLYAACGSSPCLFASGPVLAQHVRIVVTWFDAQQDMPQFQGSVLGCRFHVRQGIMPTAGTVGLTSMLFVIGRDPLAPITSAAARLEPPNVSVWWDNNSSSPSPAAVRLMPFNCTPEANTNNTRMNNASLAWVQSALGLPAWTPPSLLSARILRACAMFPLPPLAVPSSSSTTRLPPLVPAGGAGGGLWLAYVGPPPSPPSPPPPAAATVCRPSFSSLPFQATPPRFTFMLTAS